MAFQSSVLRDGEWVTETVDIQTALRTSETSKPPVESYTLPPPCGLLSRTLVESPIVHWILPARLRSKNHNDIAFVGVSSFIKSLFSMLQSSFPLLRLQ